jgi:hypothetical protein
MSYVSSVAERAILSVDRLVNQAMTYALDFDPGSSLSRQTIYAAAVASAA